MGLRRLLILLLVLILVLQVPGQPAQSAPPKITSVTLTMSDPVCDQVLPANGSCSIQFNSLSASGSDASFSRVEVLVNGKLRVYEGGFFENSAYLTPLMMPGGLLVACGRPNSGGSPDFGKSYLLTANAYMADGTSASDSASVLCPAFDGKTYLPAVRK